MTSTRLPSLGSRGEGWVALQVVCFGLLVAALVYAPPQTETDPTEIGTRQLAGYLVGLIGAVLLGSGISELRRARAMTALPYPRDDAELVERGPYRFVRHPIYSGLLLGAFGLAVITPWFGTFGAVALLAVVLDVKRRREEAWLVERYPAYPAYRTRTKALLPFLY